MSNVKNSAFKVMYIAASGVMYGANKSMFALLCDLRERYNIEPVVLIAGQSFIKPKSVNSALAMQLKEKGIKCYEVPYFQWRDFPNKSDGIINRLKLTFFNKINIISSLRVVHKESPDIIHSNTTITSLGADISRLSGIPHIWHLREYGDKDYNMNFKCGNKTIHKNFAAAKLVAISESIKKYYHIINHDFDIKTIYNGIDESDIDVANITDKAQSCKTIDFCCVGVLSKNKNQQEAIKAASILKNNGIDNFRVHFFGNGEYENHLADMAMQLGTEDKIVFHGYCADILKEISSMDVGLTLSKEEAFGRVTVEYMLSKMPVIGTDSGGTPELIQDGHNGFLYKYGNAQKLAEHMSYFIENPQTITQMGEYAREFSVEKFSMKNNTDAIYNLYRGMFDN